VKEGKGLDKESLKDYQKSEQKIKSLERRIENLKKMAARYEYGAVKGSNPDFPYQPMSFHVSGYNIREDEKKRIRIKNLESRLKKQKAAAEQERLEVEEFIAGIEETTTQLVFTYCFLDGMNQDEAAKKLHIDRSRVSRKIDDYLKTHTKHKN